MTTPGNGFKTDTSTAAAVSGEGPYNGKEYNNIKLIIVSGGVTVYILSTV